MSVSDQILLDTVTRPLRDLFHDFSEALAQSILNSPSYSLRSGTRTIPRGIISRVLGLR